MRLQRGRADMLERNAGGPTTEVDDGVAAAVIGRARQHIGDIGEPRGSLVDIDPVAEHVEVGDRVGSAEVLELEGIEAAVAGQRVVVTDEWSGPSTGAARTDSLKSAGMLNECIQ